MEHLIDAYNYFNLLLQNTYVKRLFILLYLTMFVSAVTLYALLPHNPNLVGLFVITLIFSPVCTMCFWYVITHEQYRAFEHTKNIVRVFNSTVFISIPLNHILLLVNSAIGYAHPNKVNPDAIAYTFVALGWSTVGSILLVSLLTPLYGVYLECKYKCKEYHDRHRTKPINVSDENTPPSYPPPPLPTSVVSEENIDSVMQEF